MQHLEVVFSYLCSQATPRLCEAAECWEIAYKIYSLDVAETHQPIVRLALCDECAKKFEQFR